MSAPANVGPRISAKPQSGLKMGHTREGFVTPSEYNGSSVCVLVEFAEGIVQLSE